MEVRLLELILNDDGADQQVHLIHPEVSVCILILIKESFCDRVIKSKPYRFGSLSILYFADNDSY